MIKVWHHFLYEGEALSSNEVIKSLASAGLDTCPLDLDAPGSKGVLFFDKINTRTCNLVREVSRNGIERVLVIAASRSVLASCNAWQLLGAGASDVFAWDHSADPAADVAARFERWDKVDQLVRSPVVQKSLVGQSREWVVKLRQIVEVANFTNASVLLLGESGTGKEMVARLIKEVEQGRFRRDLYSRIASWTCKLPPLRERLEDILSLARHFIDELRDGEPVEIDEPVIEHLLKRQYPANVRDLKQLVTRMVYRHVGPGPITVGDIPEEDRPSIESALENWCDASFERAIRLALAQGLGLKEIGRTAEDIAERLAVDEESGNLQRAARRLGVTDRALQIRRASRKKTIDSEQVRLSE